MSHLSQNGNVRYIMLDNTYNKAFPSKFRRVAKETPKYLKIHIKKATGILLASMLRGVGDVEILEKTEYRWPTRLLPMP